MRGMNYVYDMAFELENDLKNLSESINKSATTPLIHKIINVLEELENHSQLYEIKRKGKDDLKKSIKQLEDEEAHKEQERLLHERDLEIMEESWHSESLELMKTIEKLQEENYNMKLSIEKASKKPRLYANKRHSQQLEIINIHLKLKETIDNQIDETKLLKKELDQRNVDFEAMQQQCLNLSNINAEICENHCNNKLMSRRLMEEKANIEAQILINNKSINPNNDEVFIEDDVIDGWAGKSHSIINFSWDEVKDYLQDCNRLKSEVSEKEEQLMIFRPNRFEEGDVQGPINKEPLDKLSPNCYETGVRKYFQELMMRIKN